MEWSSNYIQTKPYDSLPPSQNTAFKTVYDNNAIYFLVRAFDAAPDIWTQNRFEWNSNGSLRVDKNVRDLFGLHPHNVFMIKLSYRFGV